jgi:uncharacterized protein YmfQ (DUF2313 family)
MAHTALEYRQVLRQLMPRGRIWSKDPDSVISQLLYGLAEELARFDERVDNFQTELTTTTSSELLTDYEEEFGITDPSCVTSEREEAIHSKLIARGRQDKTYYDDIALAMGYGVTITEFTPFWVNIGTAIQAVADIKIMFRFLVGIDVEGDRTLTDPVEYAKSLIRSFWDLMPEIDRLKPGHTMALYDFAGCEFSRAFHYMEFDAVPTNDDTIPIAMFDRSFSTDFAAEHEYDGSYLTGPFDHQFCIAYDAHVGGPFEHGAYDTGYDRTA